MPGGDDSHKNIQYNAIGFITSGARPNIAITARYPEAPA